MFITVVEYWVESDAVEAWATNFNVLNIEKIILLLSVMKNYMCKDGVSSYISRYI